MMMKGCNARKTSAVLLFVAAVASGRPLRRQTQEDSLLPAQCPAGHTLTEINFDELDLEAGTYVESQFVYDYDVKIVGKCLNQYGVARQGNWARLFDSSNPTSDDHDLGSPNKNCDGCTLATCPGFAAVDDPGFLEASKTNCVKQNNILIVHEGRRDEEPDDSSHGAYVEFIFRDPIDKFWSVELMDIEGDKDSVHLFDSFWNKLDSRDISGLGDNTVQEVDFSLPTRRHSYGGQIKMVRVAMAGSGAVTKFKWCRPPKTTCPARTQEFKVNFDKLADGHGVPSGTYVENEFMAGYIVNIKAKRFLADGSLDDSFDNVARIFDSSRPSTGDRDLGSPNEECSVCGDDIKCPGQSSDATPSAASTTNCDKQGNILIINEGETNNPDDSAGGGYIDFEFYESVPRFLGMELMDIEQGTTASIELFDSDHQSLWDTTFEGIGDNALQTADVSYSNSDIKTARLTLPDSGAVASLSYCMKPPVCPYGHVEFIIDFDHDGLSPGEFITDQFREKYGIKQVDGKRRRGPDHMKYDPGNWARIFDSSNPTSGDYDLGSPNKNCPGCTLATCPGLADKNSDGFLRANATNCEAQKNILVIHEGLAEDQPDDSSMGGYLEFVFEKPISMIHSVKVMDIEGLYNVIQVFGTSGTLLTQVRPVGMGDNTVQDVPINFKAYPEPIEKVRVNFDRSAAVLELKYCYPKF